MSIVAPRCFAIFAFTLLISCCPDLMANDGVFYAQGDHLIPMQETVVRLQKEVLKLKRMGDDMAVDVLFEFYNPGAEKQVIVGFVTPPANGDVDDATAQHPQISEFSVDVNLQRLPYKVTTLEKSGFKLDDREFQGMDFVYYFDVVFKPGLTIIHHRYQFRGGMSTELDYDFDYRLTTGNMWANEEIGDFTLEIDMGERQLFSLPWSFVTSDAPAKWKLMGKGKMGKDSDIVFDSYHRSIYTQSGAVQFKMKHFHPDRDLSILGFTILNQAYGWGRPDLSQSILEWLPCTYFAGVDGDCLADATADQLRWMRNFFYARRGYAFQRKDIAQYFSQFIWYDPIATLKMEDMQFEEWELASMNAIVAEEARRKAGK